MNSSTQVANDEIDEISDAIDEEQYVWNAIKQAIDLMAVSDDSNAALMDVLMKSLDDKRSKLYSLVRLPGYLNQHNHTVNLRSQ